MSNFPPKRTVNEELVEETFADVGKAARGVWDFLSSPDTGSFCKKFDAEHGTQLGELHARIKAGPEAVPDPKQDPNVIDMKRDDKIVIVVEEDAPCAFCSGKQVIALKGQTRTPIPCPTCKKNPGAKKQAPKLLKK